MSGIIAPGGPAWTIEKGTVAAAASKSITVTGSPLTLDLLISEYDVSAAGDLLMQINADTGAGFTYQWGMVIGPLSGTLAGDGAGSTTSMKLMKNVKPGFGARTSVRFAAPASSVYKHLHFSGSITDNTSGVGAVQSGFGIWLNTVAVTSLQLLPSTGNFSFKYHLIGIK